MTAGEHPEPPDPVGGPAVLDDRPPVDRHEAADRVDDGDGIEIDPGIGVDDRPVPPPPDAADRLLTAADPELVEPRQPTPLDRRWIVAGVAAAVAADLALRRPPWTNVAGTLLVVVLAAGLVGSGFLITRTSRVLAAASVFFGLFLSIRTDPTLLAFDLLAAGGLLVLAAVHGRGRSFWELRPLRLLADVLTVVAETVEGLVEVPAEIGARWRVAREQAEAGQNQAVWAIGRGLMITIPIVVILGLLLASADAVFSSFFSGVTLFDVPTALGHLVLMAMGAYILLVLLRVANDQGSLDAPRSTRTLGAIETGVLLVSINVLFGAFAVAQLMTVIGGADAALERAGLDPKQFARQGFFQLLWVAGLTLGLLMLVHVLTSEEVGARRITRLLAPVTVVLTVLIVGVAFTRIRFYVDDGGLTPLRLYSSVFAVWVAIAFVITAVRISGWRANRAWLLPALLVSGLTILAALNLANIERRIAIDNLGRSDASLPYHVEAGQFSGQGIALLIDGLDGLDADQAERIEDELCR
ncbi:MAG: DUF4153 domain-containing protein, partial [Actinomycetota bacterium]